MNNAKRLLAVLLSFVLIFANVILLSTPTASGGRRAGKILVGVITDTGSTGYDRYTVSWDYQYEKVRFLVPQ